AHGVPEGDLEALGRGVLLHDIGKIGISDSILLKPGPLTPEEWTVMRTHPGLGRQLLERIPFLRDAVPVVYHHHERWDGTGYPEGLAGSAIPLAARIFAVADAFDALTVDRPYSTAVSMAAARERIREASGTHFDPEVVATFLALPIDLFEKARAASPARSDAQRGCARDRRRFRPASFVSVEKGGTHGQVPDPVPWKRTHPGHEPRRDAADHPEVSRLDGGRGARRPSAGRREAARRRRAGGPRAPGPAGDHRRALHRVQGDRGRVLADRGRELRRSARDDEGPPGPRGPRRAGGPPDRRARTSRLTEPSASLPEHLFRHVAGRLVAPLTRVVGPARLDLAEEVVQEALVKAVEAWPYQGVPENPAGWLYAVARHRALDRLRREAVLRRKVAALAPLVAEHPPGRPGEHDDQLAMIFLCCHPALSQAGRMALTLKAVGGFGVDEIAAALLTRPAAIAQQLVRSKRRIRARALRFELPAAADLSARLGYGHHRLLTLV